MIKATKKELYNAFNLACFENINKDIPGGKCKGCITNYVTECPKCWMEYYLEKAKKNEERR